MPLLCILCAVKSSTNRSLAAPSGPLPVAAQGINGSGEARTWLLPLVWQHTRGAQLRYWGSNLLPAARACGGLAAAAEKAGPTHQHQVCISLCPGVAIGSEQAVCIADVVVAACRRCSAGRWSYSCGRHCRRSAPGLPTPALPSRASLTMLHDVV